MISRRFVASGHSRFATRGAVLAGCLLAALSVVLIEPLAAQAVPDKPRNFASWLDAVNTHAPGQRDDALTVVMSWPLGDLNSVLSTLSRQAPDNRLRIVERALVFHADIAMLNRTAAGYNLPGGAGATTLFADGRVLGQMTRTYHWDFARRLIDRMPRGDDRLRIARRFYRATTAVMQFWGEFPELTPHLIAARRTIGEDPVMLLFEGALRQSHAGARVQTFYAEQRRTRIPMSTTAGPPRVMSTPADALPGVSGLREEAVRLFRRALELDPALAEASIRLAHVQADRERFDEARKVLASVNGVDLPVLLDYYASLVGGRIARAQNDFDEARRCFARAAALYPNASAPKYGLSELAMATGDRALALQLLQSVAAAARVEADEPWWWLDRSHTPSAADLVVEMRQAATTP